MKEYRQAFTKDSKAMEFARFVQSVTGGDVQVYQWQGQSTVVWQAAISNE